MPPVQVLPPSVLQDQVKVVFLWVRPPMRSLALAARWTMPVAGTWVAARTSLVDFTAFDTRRPACWIRATPETASVASLSPWTYVLMLCIAVQSASTLVSRMAANPLALEALAAWAAVAAWIRRRNAGML